MIEFPVWLPLAFFVVAMVYSMAGFSGGSSYLILLVSVGISHTQAPSIALLCNITVSSCAFWQYRRSGHFNFKMAFPFVLGSIPASYLAARMITLPKEFFFVLLGSSLLIAASRLFFIGRAIEKKEAVIPRRFWTVAVPTGGFLGFLSGLLGIGGGIFLSPLLLLMRWADAKKAAAAASFFILVNSLSGLLGQVQKGAFHPESSLLFLALAALIGGQIGARLGAGRLPRISLQKITALLLLYVSINLLCKAFL